MKIKPVISIPRKYSFYFMIGVILAIKISIATLFSSAFQNQLFIPFIKLFLENILTNPWDKMVQQHLLFDFPYFPLMLWILSPFVWISSLFSAPLFENLCYKLPSLFADIFIFWSLLSIFPRKKTLVTLLYFANPIILYAVFIHGQLDLISTAFFMGSLVGLHEKNWTKTGLFLGLGLATKFHLIMVVPLFLMFLYKRHGLQASIHTLVFSIGIPILCTLPYLFSFGFYHIVLVNPKQMQLFSSFLSVGSLKLYWPVFLLGILCLRFWCYKKVNLDLLYAYVGIAFAIFLFLIKPSPGWYVWFIPTMVHFLIKHQEKNPQYIFLFSVWNVVYLIFFIHFYIPDYVDLEWLRQPLMWKFFGDEKWPNLCFTALQIGLSGCIYALYTNGVKSNAIYTQNLATIIGIGGDSGTGKTTLNQELHKILGESVLKIEGDGDHKWERHDQHWNHITHLNPKANALHRQADHLISLKHWKPVWRSDYNHHTGKFDPPKKIMPKDFIIISGLHPFYLPILRKNIDIKIYLDTEESLRIFWKINRDKDKRGHSHDHILNQIKSRKADAETFISPQKNFADLVIRFFKKNNEGTLSLEITCDTTLHLEEIIATLEIHSISIEWDYKDDLKNQSIILHQPIPTALLSYCFETFIPNTDELLSSQPNWADGYYGFIQLIFLMVLASKKGRLDHDV